MSANISEPRLIDRLRVFKHPDETLPPQIDSNGRERLILTEYYLKQSVDVIYEIQEKLESEHAKKLRDRALVLMHKKTGKLFEYIWAGYFGDVIVWEDTTEHDMPINYASSIMFNDDKKFNLNDYELLGPL